MASNLKEWRRKRAAQQHKDAHQCSRKPVVSHKPRIGRKGRKKFRDLKEYDLPVQAQGRMVSFGSQRG